VRSYIGVADDAWYQLLSTRLEVPEVNFWRPGGGEGFRTEPLTLGEPFFFKAHAPRNRIVGGGFYSGSVKLSVSEAWQLLGRANGVANLGQMLEQVARYRREEVTPQYDPVINCTFIRDVRFFSEEIGIEPPPDFKLSIVQGKSYDVDDPKVSGYFGDLIQLLLGGPIPSEPRLTVGRLGGQAFKAVVQSAYHGRCAITGSNIRPVLEAAHIRPVAQGGDHRLDNGLLLRSDVHTMFDHGYLSVDSEYGLLVSPRLREEFGSGEDFYAKRGHRIALPDMPGDRPAHVVLQWHVENVFKAS
jgi:putative restriction endonuclease